MVGAVVGGLSATCLLASYTSFHTFTRVMESGCHTSAGACRGGAWKNMKNGSWRKGGRGGSPVAEDACRQ
jgi:hypothetical protein